MSSDAPLHLQRDVPLTVWSPSRSEPHPSVWANSDRAGLSIALDVRTDPAGQVLVLQLSGEVDLFTVSTLRGALAAVQKATSCAVVVDLAAVTFCCARGFGLLAEAAEHSAAAGVRFSVSGVHPPLSRVADVVCPRGAIVRHGSVAEAVDALRVERAQNDPLRP